MSDDDDDKFGKHLEQLGYLMKMLGHTGSPGFREAIEHLEKATDLLHEVHDAAKTISQWSDESSSEFKDFEQYTRWLDKCSAVANARIVLIDEHIKRLPIKLDAAVKQIPATVPQGYAAAHDAKTLVALLNEVGWVKTDIEARIDELKQSEGAIREAEEALISLRDQFDDIHRRREEVAKVIEERIADTNVTQDQLMEAGLGSIPSSKRGLLGFLSYYWDVFKRGAVIKKHADILVEYQHVRDQLDEEWLRSDPRSKLNGAISTCERKRSAIRQYLGDPDELRGTQMQLLIEHREDEARPADDFRAMRWTTLRGQSAATGVYMFYLQGLLGGARTTFGETPGSGLPASAITLWPLDAWYDRMSDDPQFGFKVATPAMPPQAPSTEGTTAPLPSQVEVHLGNREVKELPGTDEAETKPSQTKPSQPAIPSSGSDAPPTQETPSPAPNNPAPPVDHDTTSGSDAGTSGTDAQQ